MSVVVGFEAALITGAYGVGKTAVTEELAASLDRAGARYAAIDLDWLAWAALDDHGPETQRVLLANLAAVVRNYRDAGITRFVLAGTVTTLAEIESLQMAIDMPMAVIRLTTPIEEIEHRLAADPTTGRRDDLEQAREAIAAGAGADLGDLVVANDRPIGVVAAEILAWLGWS